MPPSIKKPKKAGAFRRKRTSVPSLPDLKASIQSQLGTYVQQKMNGAAVPGGIGVAIEAISGKTGRKLTRRQLSRKARQIGKAYFQDVTLQQKLPQQLGNALKGVQLLSQSADFQQMISESAKVLFAKKAALVKAGFSDGEALQLMVAEAAVAKKRLSSLSPAQLIHQVVSRSLS